MIFHNIRLYIILFSLLSLSCSGQSARHKLHSNYSQQNVDNNVLVIDSVMDLKGGSIELPACYRIVFEGEGAIRNGKVYVDLATYSIEGGNGIFDNVDLLPKGGVNNVRKSPIREFCAQWFGVISSETLDNTQQLQRAIDAGHAFAIPVFLPRGYYRISNSLKIYEGVIFRGEYSGRITPNHQTGATFIRYCGDGKEMFIVEGHHATIENILLAGSVPYQTDGILLKKNGGEYLYLNNILLVNTRYGVTGVLDKNEGMSGCVWNNISFWKCVRGISIDINKKNGQFITYNSFNNMIVSEVLEKGVFLYCRAINSTTFRNCLFERIGYGTAYNTNYSALEIAAIYVKNEAEQGSLLIEDGYYEDIYYSAGGEPTTLQNDFLNAVYTVENVSLTVKNVRFANTRTVVRSKGKDNISLNNCIDNGFYKKNSKEMVAICIGNNETVIDINNYGMVNQNKASYKTKDNSELKSYRINNLRKFD